MLRSSRRLTLLATLMVTAAACTQQPAQIDLKGHNTYSKDGASSYSANSNYAPSAGYNSNSTYQAAPVYRSVNTSTQSSAPSGSIGVSDLSPPTAGGGSQTIKSAPQGGRSSWSVPPTQLSTPFKQASVEPRKVDINDNINPWTRKPRGQEASEAMDESFNIRPQAKAAGTKKEQMVSEVKIVPIAEQKKAAKLNSIVSNDAPVVKKLDVRAEKLSRAEPAAGGSGLMWPVGSKKIISGFGPKGGGKVNDGINIASAEGEPVWAAADGEVVYVGNELQGYGNMVLVKHSGDRTTSYAHLGRANVDKYDRVRQGDIIGYVGSTGSVKQSQLHFAIRDGKEPLDPLKQLGSNIASIR